MGLLVLAACLSLASEGCGGGAPREARVAVEQTSLGIDAADRVLAAHIAQRGPEVRRQILAEGVASVEAGLARFDRLMSTETAATGGLRIARAAVRAFERALDAWDAGNAGDVLPAAACVVAMVEDVAEVFDAVGVELPEAVSSGARVVASFATGLCPEERRAALRREAGVE